VREPGTREREPRVFQPLAQLHARQVLTIAKRPFDHGGTAALDGRVQAQLSIVDRHPAVY
jgi:hypothetical protein